jgi:lipoprotein-anchoring transpeptidase ErfK/SrfK
VETYSVDATVTVKGNRLVVVPSRVGVTVDREATLTALESALTEGVKRVGLVASYTKPALTEDELGPAIVVDLSERRLYLYVNGKLEKKYGVAVGAPSFPTPQGRFRIVLKRYMPTWSNPGSAWAADMPKSIPPGVTNPLGTRALNLDAPGIRIHGTSKDYSIGTAASHGCMRMHRWDIEDLYDRVEVGTPVFIVP